MPSLVAILLGAAARGAVVLLVALVLTSLLHRRPAAVRHAIWAGAIAVQLLLPVLSLWGPHWSVPVPEAMRVLMPEASIMTSTEQSRDAQPVLARSNTAETTPATTRVGQSSTAPTPSASATTRPGAAPAAAAPGAAVPPTATPTPAPAAATGTPLSLRALLLVVWAIGVAFVLLRLAVGTMIVARLARRGARIDDGGWLSLAQRLANTLRIQRPLILLRGDRLGVPVTWGVVYPIVLLPEDADEWTEERRRYVLVHEMAHVKRLDALTQLLGQVALALFWFDPLVWIANRRLQLEREHACDDYVLRHGTQPSTYAADLLSMVQSLGTPAHRSAQPAFAALAMARRSEFEGRMLSILDPVLDRHPLNRGRTLMSAFATLLLVVPLAALQPIRQTPQSSASATHADSASVSRSTSQTRSQAEGQSLIHGLNITVPDSSWSAGSDGPLGQGLTKLGQSARKLDSAGIALGRKVASLDTIRTRTEANGGVTETLSGSRDDDSCDQLRFGDSNASFHMHDNVDDHAARNLRMLNITRDHCVQAMIQGRFTTSPAEDRITGLSNGSVAIFRERAPGSDRAVTITPGDGSSAVRVQYRFNDASAPFDDAAQRWLAGILPQILAEAGVNVDARIARWRAEGGTDAVLRHIAQLRSSGAKRAHYDALLDQKLPAADLQRVVAQAGKDIPSSGDLRAVLSKAGAQSRTSGVAPSTLETSIGAIASSTDRTAVLEVFGQTDDRDQLLAVARVAATIPSSTDKASLLSGLVPKYLSRNDAALRDAFFKAVATIASSTDLSNVLTDAIPFAVKSNEVALAIIAIDSMVPSSTDKSNVLIALAERGAIRTPAARDAYLRAVQGIASSTDMRNALEALTKH
jgi:beta-lactamase regulating signal transducer with metallopeptidase domain